MSNANAQERAQVAQIIIQQLGGQARLKMMCGAKNFVAVDGGLQFMIGSNPKRINKVRIILNGRDLYDVEFGKLRMGANIDYKIVDSAEDVYAEDLVRVFEQSSGLYLSF